MTDRLAGTRALVVGGSRGIGRGVAERYAAEGASVAVAARSAATIESVASALGTEALAVECDLRDTGSVERAVDRTIETFGGLDVVFNSAGVLNRQPVSDADVEEMATVIDTNLTGAIRLSKASLPHLVDAEGSLIHVSSEAGQKGIGALPAYCASKAGLDNLVRSLAVEYGPEDVNGVAIAPGTTKTPMNESVREEDPDWVEERAEKIPMRRLGTVEDVSNLAVFLASDEASYITGEVVSVDGGSTA